MEKRVVMCADGQSLRNPAMVGLAGEPLDALGWLACASGAEECRKAARLLSAVEEAWIVSCDDMEKMMRGEGEISAARTSARRRGRDHR